MKPNQRLTAHYGLRYAGAMIYTVAWEIWHGNVQNTVAADFNDEGAANRFLEGLTREKNIENPRIEKR